MKRTSGRFGRVYANAIIGEQVHRVFHQIPPHHQKQDHHGEGVDVQSHSLIGNSELSSCSTKLLMFVVVSGLGRWMWEEIFVRFVGERTFVRDVHACSGGKVNVSPRRVQVCIGCDVVEILGDLSSSHM